MQEYSATVSSKKSRCTPDPHDARVHFYTAFSARQSRQASGCTDDPPGVRMHGCPAQRTGVLDFSTGIQGSENLAGACVEENPDSPWH